MRDYKFIAGDKERMFDSIGSHLPGTPEQVVEEEKSFKATPTTSRLPVLGETEQGVEKPVITGQPQSNREEIPDKAVLPVTIANPIASLQIPMTKQDLELEFGSIDPELEQIRSDEGFRTDVYDDGFGNLTVGTGHKLRGDELEKYKEGDVLTEDELEDILEQDYDVARSDAEKFAPDDTPEEALDIVTNMSFQLGYPRLSTFKKFKQALKEKDYNKAADEMLDSKWYKEQTPERANRLADRMRALADSGEV